MSLFDRGGPYPDDDNTIAAAEWRRMRDAGTLDNTFADFPVGARVRVVASAVDFFFFRGDETGEVETNSGRYLGIRVRFHEPMVYTDGHVKTHHGFDPSHLARLREPLDWGAWE